MRSSSWPFLTVSPRRARTSTTRPEASVTTGTVRATSGYTAPFTTNFDGASYCVAVATGYRSGWSTPKCDTSRPETTVAGGGASAATLSFVPQPPNSDAAAIAKMGRNKSLSVLLLRISPPDREQVFFRTSRDTPLAFGPMSVVPEIAVCFPNDCLCDRGRGPVGTERQK